MEKKPKFDVHYYLEDTKMSEGTQQLETAIPECRDFYEVCGRTGTSLMAMKSPPVEYAVNGVFARNSCNGILGSHDSSLSWVVLQAGISMSTGQSFFGWKVPKPLTTVIIEGERGLVFLKQRVEMLHPDPLDNLYFVTADDFLKAGKPINIMEMETQTELERYFSLMGAKVLIFDNPSYLCGEMDENANQDEQVYWAWFSRMRILGYTVIFVDHQGKNGGRLGRRGASKKEDFAHTLIEISPTGGKNQADFTISLTKCRHERPERNKVRVCLNSDSLPAKWETMMDRA